MKAVGLVACGFVGLAACGYSLGQAEKLPLGISAVYVPEAGDAGLDVGPGATLTRVLRGRFLASMGARHVTRDQAQAVVEASIDSTRDNAGLSGVPDATARAVVQKYTVVMTGSARLIDSSARVVWESGATTVAEDYLSGLPSVAVQAAIEGALPITESNRRRALERAAERLAHELYARLMEGF